MGKTKGFFFDADTVEMTVPHRLAQDQDRGERNLNFIVPEAIQPRASVNGFMPRLRLTLLFLCLAALSTGAIAIPPSHAQSSPTSAELDAGLAEHVPTKPTPGKLKVEAAFQFQRRLLHSLETIDAVIKNWAKTAKMPEVKKDRDAEAISYGCEGLMEIERDSSRRADSLLKRALPLFRYKDSKSYFVLALAQLEAKRSFYIESMYYYRELLTNFDSLDALKDITFYAESGYAPYAYGIDAALHITNFGMSISELKDEAIYLLKRAAAKHELDALGLMANTSLKHIDPAHAEDYNFKIEQLCSRKPDLRKAADKFEKQFTDLK